MNRLLICLKCLAIVVFSGAMFDGYAQTSDGESLGKAIAYFQSGKYHEARIILQRLDKLYHLNPRFQAYLGVSCFYEQEYQEAANNLDAAIPKLSSFSPQERSFYFFADAESHFYLGQYDQALRCYTQMLALCHENEKADAFYKIGLIYCLKKQWLKALDALQNALVYLQKYNPEKKSRITQIKNMIFGCCGHIENGIAK